MSVLQAILNRRSIRTYQPDAQVTEEQVHDLLEAAMMAPSAHNGRPWEFVVVRDRGRLEALRKAHPYTGMLSTATLAIVVCISATPEDAISDGFVQQDCGAATQNILLQATASGLGSCWCGVYPREAIVEAVRNVLNIAETLTPFNVIAIGVPAEEPERRGSYEDARVHLR